MLRITTPEVLDAWDERINEFISIPSCVLTLEHSLVSISKWESKWHKPFLSQEPKTKDEILDYVRCMTLTQNVNPNVYLVLSNTNIDEVTAYIKDSMTATWFGEKKSKKGEKRPKILTNELIYYYMFELNIPKECEKWHLNRLLTLIRIFNEENKKPEKVSRKEKIAEYIDINERNRARFNSKG